MDEIIKLSNFLKEAFSNDSYAYRDIKEELINVENRISELDNKLSNMDNYKKDIKGETFIQEMLTQHASNNREENVEEYNGLIYLADQEISELNSQISAINDNLENKAVSLSQAKTEEEKNSIQKEIRILSDEKYTLRQEISKLNEDKDYFVSEKNKLEAEIDADKDLLEKFENSKIDQEQLNKDKKEIISLQLEVRHLEKYMADLTVLNNFFDIVSKIENNEPYSNENLESILEQISNINVNQQSLNEIIELINKKTLEQQNLNEKISIPENYQINSLVSNSVRMERYEKLRKNNEENYKLTEQLLDSLEAKMEPLRNNRKEQENTLNEISLLAVKFREDATQDQYYQDEFKKLYAKVDKLREEEKELVVSSDEINYESSKKQLLDRKNRITNDLIHIEKLTKIETRDRFNYFKRNEDEIRLSMLKNEIKSLTNIVELFSKVKEAKEIYGLSKFKDDSLVNVYEILDNQNKTTLPGISVDNFDLPAATDDTKNQDDNIVDITDTNDDNIIDITDVNDNLDYKPTGKVTIIDKIKGSKNFKKVTKQIKTKLKAILATALVGIASLSGCASSKADSKIDSALENENITKTEFDNEDLKNNYDDVASEILNSIENDNSNINKEIENFNIGDTYAVSGDIYKTSIDAFNKTNGLEHYYPLSDSRTISAIEFVSPYGEHITVTENNKEQAELLRQLGWTEESYCTSNETRNLEYEGWHNLNDNGGMNAKSR